jgi:hypothetical protein
MQGHLDMELAGLEPATSWVRSRRFDTKFALICRQLRAAKARRSAAGLP